MNFQTTAYLGMRDVRRGCVDQAGETRIETTVTTVRFIPFLPCSSHLIYRDSDGEMQVIAIPLHLRSTLAAFLRTWGPLLTLGLAAWTSHRFVHSIDPSAGFRLAFYTAAAFAISVYAWFVLGRLSADEQARRLTYQKQCGRPLEVLFQNDERTERMAATLRDDLVERASTLGGLDYRTGSVPEDHWLRVAADPSVLDPGFLEPALTLTRLDLRGAHSGERSKKLRSGHEAIARKLRALRPSPRRDWRSFVPPAVACVAAIGIAGFLTGSYREGMRTAPADPSRLHAPR